MTIIEEVNRNQHKRIEIRITRDETISFISGTPQENASILRNIGNIPIEKREIDFSTVPITVNIYGLNYLNY